MSYDSIQLTLSQVGEQLLDGVDNSTVSSRPPNRT
jgi:hypothetical protein